MMHAARERGAAPSDFGDENASVTIQDPIYLRRLDLGDAAGGIEHDGWAYFFCSDACRKRFQTMSARRAGKPVMAAGGRSQSVPVSLDKWKPHAGDERQRQIDASVRKRIRGSSIVARATAEHVRPIREP